VHYQRRFRTPSSLPHPPSLARVRHTQTHSHIPPAKTTLRLTKCRCLLPSTRRRGSKSRLQPTSYTLINTDIDYQLRSPRVLFEVSIHPAKRHTYFNKADKGAPRSAVLSHPTQTILVLRHHSTPLVKLRCPLRHFQLTSHLHHFSIRPHIP
jgi:hypothetical protein